MRVGTAELVIDVDVEEVLVVVAVTEVILPPDTVIETATDPYWCVTAGPANVPSFNPLAGAAVVAFTVVAAAVVALAAVVAAAAVVAVLLVAAVVPALLAAELAAALDAAPDVCPAADADGSAPGVCEASSDTAAADGSPDVKDVGSGATAGAPTAVWPPRVAADHAAARIPADVTTAAALPLALTRRTFRCGSRSRAYPPPAHHR